MEEQFYLVWPWIVFALRDRRKLMWICAATVPLCLGLRIAGQIMLPAWMVDREVLYRVTPFRLDALLLGGLIALILRGPGAAKFLRMARVTLPLAAAAVLAWMLATPAHHVFQIPYPYPSWRLTWGLLWIDLLSGLLIVVALQPGTVIHRIFNLPVLRWMGRLSYGAYVLHDIPHSLYNQVGDRLFPTHGGRSRLTTTIVGLICTYALAWLSFRFFETPFLNLKDRWTIRERTKPAPVTEMAEAEPA